MSVRWVRLMSKSASDSASLVTICADLKESRWPSGQLCDYNYVDQTRVHHFTPKESDSKKQWKQSDTPPGRPFGRNSHGVGILGCRWYFIGGLSSERLNAATRQYHMRPFWGSCNAVSMPIAVENYNQTSAVRTCTTRTTPSRTSQVSPWQLTTTALNLLITRQFSSYGTIGLPKPEEAPGCSSFYHRRCRLWLLQRCT